MQTDRYIKIQTLVRILVVTLALNLHIQHVLQWLFWGLICSILSIIGVTKLSLVHGR